MELLALIFALLFFWTLAAFIHEQVVTPRYREENAKLRDEVAELRSVIDGTAPPHVAVAHWPEHKLESMMRLLPTDQENH